MIRTIDLRGSSPDLATVLPRADFVIDTALAAVVAICDDVRDRGATAVMELSSKFDHVTPPSLLVPPEAIEDAVAGLDAGVRKAVMESIRRRRIVCEKTEVELALRSVTLAPGARVDTRVVPVSRVGLYVPGGLAPLASSVFMNAVPA